MKPPPPTTISGVNIYMSVQLLKNIVTFPFVAVAVVVDLFLLINGTAFFGTQFASYRFDLELYLVMLAAIGIFQSVEVREELHFGIGAVMVGFVPGFLFTAVALDNLNAASVIHASSLGAGYIVLQLMFYIFVVAFSEEFIFRGYLMGYLTDRAIPYPYVVQGILFGLFHYYAYSDMFGYEWYSILTAMVFGTVLGAIVYFSQRMGKGSTGLGLAIGIHAGWDVALSTGLFRVGGIL